MSCSLGSRRFLSQPRYTLDSSRHLKCHQKKEYIEKLKMQNFVGCILACTFLCICLNMAFLYVIFEQKRTCDERISDLDFELESYFHQQLAGEMKKIEKKSEPKFKQIKTVDKMEKKEKTERDLTPKEEREMLQEIADQIEDGIEQEHFSEVAIKDESKTEKTTKAIETETNKIDKPDFLEAYPPMDIEPFKHKKTEKIKIPPPNSPGNMGTDKDWQIPQKFINDGDYKKYRTFRYLIEPKNIKPHSTFLLVVQSSTEELIRRNTIRETYGKMAVEQNVALIFNIGRTTESLAGRFVFYIYLFKIFYALYSNCP